MTENKYKFTPDYKTKNEIEYFLLKEMDEFNSRTGELLDSGMLRFMRSESHFKEFDFLSIPNRWLDLLEEKEQSPAGEWIDKRYGIKDEKLYFKAFPIKYPPPYTYLKSHMLEAHEAGQKHGSDVERKNVRELTASVREFTKCAQHIKTLKENSLEFVINEWVDLFIKNLEENEPASDEPEISEKPSWITAKPNQELTFSINGKLVKIKIPDGGESIEIDTELGIQISRKTEKKS